MHKLFAAWIILGAAAALAASDPLWAQNTASSSSSLPLFGKVHLKYHKQGIGSPTSAQVSGQVTMTSENYDLSCETLTFLLNKLNSKSKPGIAGSSISKVTAEGDAAKGTQVTADIRRPLESQAFHILADHAVYVPDKANPGVIRTEFTGHVEVTTISGFLAEPSVTTTDHVMLLLGPGNDYPQIETGPAEVTVTPAQ